MGTSASSNGPKNGSPLLPPWADDNFDPQEQPQRPPQEPPEEQPEDQPDNNDENPQSDEPPVILPTPKAWGTAKSRMTGYTNNRDRSYLNKAAKSYIHARGGPAGAARSAMSGRQMTANFGNFLTSVLRNGINSTLQSMGLDMLIGKPANIVLMSIADKISPIGADQENSVARNAAIDTMEYLYNKYELNTEDITKLDSMDKEAVVDAFEFCVASYIFERWLDDLGKRLEINAISETEAVRMEQEVKEYVFEAVKYDFNDYDIISSGFSSNESERIIEQIYREAYMHLEVIE